MQDIYVKDTDDQIRLSIHIEFEGTSRFVYTMPEPYKQITEETENEPGDQGMYKLGKGTDRVKPLKNCDNWTVELINPGEKELTYKIVFEWKQDTFPVSLYIWPEKEDDREGKVAANTMKSLKDNVTYRKI